MRKKMTVNYLIERLNEFKDKELEVYIFDVANEEATKIRGVHQVEDRIDLLTE